jgi:hypothetical protein
MRWRPDCSSVIPMDWLDGIRAFKAEADAVIRQMARRALIG